MQTMIANYWLEFLMGIVSTGLIACYKNMFNRQNAIGNGVKALLRERIIDRCNHYRDKSYCPTYALETIEAMYNEYKTLGGNGAITTLVKEMHDLPREKKERKAN